MQKIKVTKLDEYLRYNGTQKTLLLIDGWDEMSHILSNNTGEYRVEHNIKNQILEFRNIIMTTRPNAVPGELLDKFPRKVSNIGLDENGIKQYVKKTFLGSSEATKVGDEKEKAFNSFMSFLEQNPKVEEACKIPINLTLICLVWENENYREELLTAVFSLSRLYDNVISWLSKKYLNKFDKKLKDTTISAAAAEEMLESKLVQFLEKLAYEAFVVYKGFNDKKDHKKESNLIINQELIKGVLENYKLPCDYLKEINTFGVLKAVREKVTDITKENHEFVHLSFQEYFQARYLVKGLGSREPKIAKDTYDFIAEHRYDQRYLMTWKFMAGMVTSSTSSNNNDVVRRFWEAMSCNLDGSSKFVFDIFCESSNCNRD